MAPSPSSCPKEHTVTRSLTARTRVLAAGAALLLTVGALTGCTGRPGQAADLTFTGLDGARHSIVVSEAEVQGAIKELKSYTALYGQRAPENTEIAAGIFDAPIIEEVGRAHGISVTDDQIVQTFKTQDGFEFREPATISYLRTSFLIRQFQQNSGLFQEVQADYRVIRSTRTGAVSPRFPESKPAWFTETDPRLKSDNHPAEGNQQQGGQQAPQRGGQQQPQQGSQQPGPQDGAEQPADPGQTDRPTEGEQGSADGAAQPGQADVGTGEDGQGEGRSEDGAQQGADGAGPAPSGADR